MSLALTWGMSMAVIGGFILVGWHAHFALHLGVGTAFLAMVIYLFMVGWFLCINLWFMAGQKMFLEALALYEPTSCLMEWIHDSIFGIDEERLATAYTVGGHKGKKTKDGKKYIQLIVPRRRIPYPFSVGGLIHHLFFAADDPFDPDQTVTQIMRSLLALSLFTVVLQTSVAEWLYHADALFIEASSLQSQGDLTAAIEKYQIVIKQDPLHNPHVAAVHFSHLFLRHPWAAGMYIVAATFHAKGQLTEAAMAYGHVLDHVPDCPLASHPLSAISSSSSIPASSNSSSSSSSSSSTLPPPPPRAPAGYVKEAFDGYAAAYEQSMDELAYRAPEMLALALQDVMEAQNNGENGAQREEGTEGGGRGGLKALDLGCGTGLLGALLKGAGTAAGGGE
eukprot:CAMPEP_0181311360 /NCGR_PEP_ID=MMETSP1101-20121128/13092_1 /TAXON_ID=46948 /ORGANISM="Rhodomonas abbreviata, Strain Caron Lab Isolate" /LENGTH=392 /DNA_ID=CAMNT_0023418079 /DNA_START=182 /DNA_END=1357 /DNA_ORIENTATION=-